MGFIYDNLTADGTTFNVEQIQNSRKLLWQRLAVAHVRLLSPAIAMRPTVIIIFIMAVCTGMALFNYLYSQKACNMIHAMPVTRTRLYFTNVITGLVIMWFPQIVRFVISLMICISNGMTDIKPLGIWLLSSMAISFLAYGIVCFPLCLQASFVHFRSCI